jgi:cysteine-rich repeat protein
MQQILKYLLVAAVALTLLVVLDAEAAKPRCGDGQCKGSETAQSCPADCSVTPPPGDTCGDGVCGGDESCSTCASDCGACTSCNNDGVCNTGEDCLGCADCPGKLDGRKSGRYCCGSDTCDFGLCGAGACTSASPVCGNGVVEYTEECDDGNLDSGDGCDFLCNIETSVANFPVNQFNIGDSIGEAEAADGTLGSINHDRVWSTGYSASDGVDSLNERFTGADPGYTPNDSGLDPFFNQAISGSIMADFAAQAEAMVAASTNVPSGTVGMTTVLLGANDVCAANMNDMTNPVLFEQQYRAGLDVLASSPVPENVNVLVSSLPAIYWLWESKRSNFICRSIIWPFVPCQNLLSNSGNDCASSQSTEDPDTIYPSDGANCQRRKTLHAQIRDVYNPILSGVLEEYQANGKLPNAEFVDVFDVRFEGVHVNNGDCFHPSTAGHSLLSNEQWCRSSFGADDASCGP